MAIAFVLWEWKFPKFPLMPRMFFLTNIRELAQAHFRSVYIFKNRVVVGAILTQTINGFLTVVQVFLLPTFYQLAYGYSPVKSGAMVLPITLIQSECTISHMPPIPNQRMCSHYINCLRRLHYVDR